MNSFVIKKYLVSEFLKSVFNTLLIFFCVGLIMNLFEEINYFEKYDVGITLPITLSFMIIPSFLINLLPFILFLSSMWTFIKLRNSRDLLSLKTFGFSNANFLFLFCATAFFIGIFTLTAVNPLTSVLVKSYEDIKGSYDLDKSHLASINSNGIWIKERIENNINIIKSEDLDGDYLINASIYKFDKNNVLLERISAKKINISNTSWLMENVYIVKFKEENTKQNFKTLSFESNFNKEKLNSIYSNLDTISFYRLVNEKNRLIDKGYNSMLLDEKKHFYLSLPFFLIVMVCLAGIFTLNSNEKRENVYYILLSIIICVIIFYFKNFSTALGSTERIPLILSVWAPIFILSLFCSVAVIQINEK